MKRRRPARLAFALRDHETLFDGSDRRLARRLAWAYVVMACIGGGLAARYVDGGPWRHPEAILAWPSFAAASASAAVGVAFAFFVVVSSRWLLVRAVWARELAEALSPIASRLSDRGIATVAVLSSLGEELLFRSLLVPMIGVLASSALFGLAHQVRGRARFLWMAWAMAVGLVLGSLFELFGSIVGPFLAHALINGANLAMLRTLARSPAASPRPGDANSPASDDRSGPRDPGSD